MKKQRTMLCFVICILFTVSLFSFDYQVIPNLPGISEGEVAWGDFDNDGLLDLVITGSEITRIYRNEGNGIFTDIDAGLPGVQDCSVAWGDFDNDGLPDLVIAGSTGHDQPDITRIYRNEGNGVFTDINAGLSGVRHSSVAWGDFDNDGLLDLVIAGYTGSTSITRIYRNEGNGVFTDINVGLPGANGSVAWGDYDNDGLLDLVIAGSSSSGLITRIYRNDGNGIFTDIDAWLPRVSSGSVAWGDFDNNGLLDFVITGSSNNGSITRIYRNEGSGIFSDINAGLPGIYNSEVAWGDFDNDGLLDLAIAGYDVNYNRITRVYRNEGNDVFTDINAGLSGVIYASVAWGDFDNNGLLDLVIAGSSNNGSITRIYRNNLDVPVNNSPLAPENIIITNDKVFWSHGSDTETPDTGLYYNVEIYADDELVANSMSLDSGKRKVLDFGNAQKKTFFILDELPVKNEYQFKVQTIDTGLMASEFANLNYTNSLTFINPAQNTVWTAGQSQRIFWNALGKAQVIIQLSINNGQSWISLSPAPLALSQQEYFLNIVPNFPSELCKLRLRDATDTALIYFESEQFSIVNNPNQSLTVSSYPKVLAGDTLTLNWASEGLENLNIDFYNQDTSTWAVVAENIPASLQEFQWQAPNNYIDKGFFKFSSVETSFETVSADIKVVTLNWINPATDTHWLKNTHINFRWADMGINRFKLQYSLNNRDSLITIATNYSYNSYSYLIPDVFLGNNILFRISDFDSPYVYRDINILINHLQMFEINGRVAGNKETIINWTSTNIDNIKIEFSANNKHDWNVITESYPADSGTFSWEVPAIISNQCYIRISEVGAEHNKRINEQAFTIHSLEVLDPNGGELVQPGAFYEINFSAYEVENVYLVFFLLEF